MVKSVNDISTSHNDLAQQVEQQPPAAPLSQEPIAQVELQTPQIEQPQGNVKDFAKKKGHIDKETWVAQGRDPDLYVDEETWVKNYTWLNQINELKKETREQKEALEYLVKQNKLAEELGRAKAIEDLKRQQIDAIASGDPEKVTEITEKLVVEQSRTKGIATENIAPGTDPRVVAFLERNKSWFNMQNANNAAARSYAITRESELAQTNPLLPIDERFKIVENEVKSKFLSNPAIPSYAAPVAPASASPLKKDEHDLSSLPDFHQKMIQRLKKTTRNFDVNRYIQQVHEVEMQNYKDTSLR